MRPSNCLPLVFGLVFTASGCPLVFTAVTDGGVDLRGEAGPDAGDVTRDGGRGDGGVPDGGRRDAGTPDGGSLDAGEVDGGRDDGGVIDGGEIDAGEVDGGVDAGEVDAGELDGGTPGIFVGEPYPEAEARVRIRLIAMNLQGEAEGVPLVANLPAEALEEHPLSPETVRVVEGQEVLPSLVDAAVDGQLARVYFRVPTLRGEATDQEIYIYWGAVAAAAIPASTARVFPSSEYYGVYASFVDGRGPNLVTDVSDFTFTHSGPLSASAFGQGLAPGSTLTMSPFENAEAAVGVSIFTQWPSEPTDAPILTTGGSHNIVRLGDGRARFTSPISNNVTLQMGQARGYLAVEVEANNVHVHSARDDDREAIANITTPAAFLQGLTLGDAAWTGVIDEVRVARQTFNRTHHEALGLTYAGDFLEVLAAPLSYAPFSPPAESYAIAPDHRFLLNTCAGGSCPSVAGDVSLELSEDEAAGPDGISIEGVNIASASFIPCAVDGGMTVSLWYRPDNLQLDGPARIATWSKDIRNQIFTIGQEKLANGSARFGFRGLTNRDRTPGRTLHSQLPSVTQLHHLAVSIPAQGSGEDLIFCVDGVCESNATDPQAGTTLPDDLETESDWAIRIGNEIGQERAAPGLYSDLAFWCAAHDDAFLQGVYNARSP